LNEIAQEFAVHPTQVGEWKKTLPAQAPEIFNGKRGPKPDDSSVSPERLYYLDYGILRHIGSG
jgi:hypothetical protein